MLVPLAPSLAFRRWRFDDARLLEPFVSLEWRYSMEALGAAHTSFVKVRVCLTKAGGGIILYCKVPLILSWSSHCSHHGSR